MSLIELKGEPLTKLIECVSKGIGTLYEPRRIRKEADAEAYRLKTLEKARVELATLADDDYNLQRNNQRLVAKEIRRQNNLDSVVEKTAKLLQQNKAIPKGSVDTDWATAFFNHVVDISNSEMQDIWCRILAGEIEQPQSYSLRLLALLKTLSQQEAILFTKACKYIIYDTKQYYFIEDKSIVPQNGISYDDKCILQEIGLIEPIGYSKKNQFFTHKQESIFLYQDVMLLYSNTNEQPVSFPYPITSLTKIGEQLFKLVTPEFDDHFITSLEQSLKRRKLKVIRSNFEYKEDKTGLIYLSEDDE